MTSIMIGFNRVVHRLGTVYGNYSLSAADTGIYAAGPTGSGSGDSTINLPATPSTNQTISITNTGTGNVTVTNGVITYLSVDYDFAVLISLGNIELSWNGTTWDVVIVTEGTTFGITLTYATWDSASIIGGFSLTNSDKTVTGAGATPPNESWVRANIGKTSGLWYWEITINSVPSVPVETMGLGITLVSEYGHHEWGIDSSGSYGQPGDVFGFRLHFTTIAVVDIYRNNILQTSVGIVGSEGQPVTAAFNNASTSSCGVTANFGESAFVYSVPNGYNSGLYE